MFGVDFVWLSFPMVLGLVGVVLFVGEFQHHFRPSEGRATAFHYALAILLNLFYFQYQFHEQYKARR